MVTADEILKFGKINVPITHSDKLFWPEEGITKGMLINYYQSVAQFILPFLRNRPQSLLRNPNGILDKGFFHKDAGEDAPEWVKTYPVYAVSTDKTIDYIVCNNKTTLAYMNNLGCIEINPWHSTIFKPDYPDYLIIDIDPSANNNFEEVMDAARACRDVFAKAKVECYCKTSGATGMHVYVPMGRKYEYAEVKKMAQLVCIKVNEALPTITTLERNVSKRGSRIYLDFLQNSKGQTIASVYSVRPRKGATVSMPLDWKELKSSLSPNYFNIFNAPARIKRKQEMFAGILGKGINLHKCMKMISINLA